MLSGPQHSSERRKDAFAQEHQKKANQIIASLPSLPPHICDPADMSAKVCAICLDPLVLQPCAKRDVAKRTKKTITMTACNHHMHRQCLATWFCKDLALSCPVCRVRVKPDEENMINAYQNNVETENSSMMVLDRQQEQGQQQHQQLISYRLRLQQQNQVQEEQQRNVRRLPANSETRHPERRRGMHGFRHWSQISNTEGGRHHFVRKKVNTSHNS